MPQVSCPKCGDGIRYIPTKDSHIVVEGNYTEVITDSGRIIQGYLRHECKVKLPPEGKGNI